MKSSPIKTEISMRPVTRLLSSAAAVSALAAFGLVAGHTATFAARACTDKEVRTNVTDAFIISCTGVGGTVKCTDSGRQTCCKTYTRPSGTVTHCSTSVNTLPPSRVSDPPPSRPPRVGGDVPPGRVSPPLVSRPPRADPPPGNVNPQPISRPPRADPPPSRVDPPKSSGPSIR